MSSCSPMLTPIYGITPTEQQLALLPAGAILRDRHNRKKGIYYGCLPPSALLAVIILVHTSIIAIWMLREYYFFDFKCAILQYEFGSAMNNDEKETTLNVARDAGSVKHTRGRGPRQLLHSHSAVPAWTSLNKDWQLDGFQILKMESATFSLRRRRRSMACGSRKSTAFRYCQPGSIWMEKSALLPRNRRLLNEPVAASKRSGHQHARSSRINRRRQRSVPANLLLPSRGEEWKTTFDAQISEISDLQTQLIPSEPLRTRRSPSQQRANANQFGRPVRPKFDVVTSVPKLRPVGYFPSSNNSRSRDNKTSSRNTLPRMKPFSVNGSRNWAPLKTSPQTVISKAPNMRHFSVIGNRRETHLKSNRRKSSIKDGRSSSSRSGTKSWAVSRPGAKKKPIQNGWRKLPLISLQNTTRRRVHSKKHKSGESWEENEAKPTKKRFHFLSGPGAPVRRNSTHRSSWINGVIHPADENFSNKGDIRFYRGRLAKKKPKRLKRPKSMAISGSAAHIREPPDLHQRDTSENHGGYHNEENNRMGSRTPKNATSSEQSLDIKKKAERKWKSAEDVVRRPSQRVKSSKEHIKKGSASREGASSEAKSPLAMKLDGMETSLSPEAIKSSATHTPSSPTVATTVNVLTTSALHNAFEDGYSMDEERRRLENYDKLYHSASIGPIPRKSTIGPMIGILRSQVDGVEVDKQPMRVTSFKPTTTPLVIETTTELSEEMMQKRRENFIAQLSTFSDSAMCIARTLLDLWCAAECGAAIPFLIGIWCPMRWLFAAHIILDTLFLVIAFIYSITLAVYSVILYMLVDDMGIWTLLRWLGFATAVDVVLAVYIVIFIITLRCCELVVDDGRSLKPRRCLSDHYSYQEVRTLDGNEGNAV